ncbi:hypothetical protein DFH09DRAFT_1075771 [Mycena vulgaris]|nr:hypothetical protein DFH09DRAFT_1075771 [Mycena vulgaris]
MSGLPDVLKIPDGPEKLSIPAGDLPVSALIKLKLPPHQRGSWPGVLPWLGNNLAVGPKTAQRKHRGVVVRFQLFSDVIWRSSCMWGTIFTYKSCSTKIIAKLRAYERSSKTLVWPEKLIQSPILEVLQVGGEHHRCAGLNPPVGLSRTIRGRE